MTMTGMIYMLPFQSRAPKDTAVWLLTAGRESMPLSLSSRSDSESSSDGDEPEEASLNNPLRMQARPLSISDNNASASPWRVSLPQAVDEHFLKTLLSIRKRDPAIYQKDTKLFPDEGAFVVQEADQV